MKIIFFGTPNFSLSVRHDLKSGFTTDPWTPIMQLVFLKQRFVPAKATLISVQTADVLDFMFDKPEYS